MPIFRPIPVPREKDLSSKMSGPFGPHVRVKDKEKQFPQEKDDAFPKAERLVWEDR